MRRNGAVIRPAEAIGRLFELAVVSPGESLDLVHLRCRQQPGRGGLALGAPRPHLPVGLARSASARPTSRPHGCAPRSRSPGPRRHRGGRNATTRQVRRQHLPRLAAHLHAVVEVVAVARSQRLVEPDVPHRPRGKRHQHAVDGVDLTRTGVGPGLPAAPAVRCEPRKLLALEFTRAVDRRRPGGGSLPPRDARDPHGPGAADDGDVGIGERLPSASGRTRCR